METDLRVYSWIGQYGKDFVSPKNIAGPDLRNARKAITTINTPLYTCIGKQAGAEGPFELVILLEAMRVVALDKYHETTSKSLKQLANSYKDRLRGLLSEDQFRFLERTEKHAFPYWDWEKRLAKQMHDEPIPIGEIESFTLAKSTDAYIYWNLLNLFVDVGHNVGDELYRHQLIRDVLDDFLDIEEDILMDQPNPVLLRARHHQLELPGDKEGLTALLFDSGVMDDHTAFVKSQVIEIPLPQEYEWLRDCMYAEPSEGLNGLLDTMDFHM